MRPSYESTLTHGLGALTIVLSFLGAMCFAQDVAKEAAKPEWRVITPTDLSGSDCQPADSARDEGGRICKGVEGYSLLLKGDEQKPEIYLIAPNGRRHPLRYWDTSDPKLRELRGYAIWTVINLSKKIIEVSFTVETAPRQDYSQIGTYNIIASVVPGPVCIVSSVGAGPQDHAEGWVARGRHCLKLNQREKKDWFMAASRLASEGQIRAARQALTRVHNPPRRFIVYHEMASAQFKAGNAEGARRTLIGVRAEALRSPFRDDRSYTLIHVVAGLTESGFYEDAKSDIKWFSESEKLRMYLMVAGIQGEKKDLEAAKTTFQDAVQWVLKKGPQANGNLQEIGIKQVEMGLIDEARKTASMIRDAALREYVEQRIRERLTQAN